MTSHKVTLTTKTLQVDIDIELSKMKNELTEKMKKMKSIAELEKVKLKNNCPR